MLPGYGQPLLVLLPAFLPARLSRARSQSLPAHLPRAWACSLPAYLPWAWPCSLPAYLPRAHPARRDPAPLAPLAPPARRVSLDLTVPLALPALRVFPVPHLSSKQKPLPPIRQINGRLMINIITSLPFMISNCRDRVLRYFNKGLI